ncbi:MAG: hypothetical protein ACE5HB_06620, partial [Terriglobia bacterium]
LLGVRSNKLRIRQAAPPHRYNHHLLLPATLAIALSWLVLPELAAQSGGAWLEFHARAAPTQGQPEKVMRKRFYLLRASLEEIEGVARKDVPAPALDALADELKVSDQLKAWMKERQTVNLQGDDFLAQLEVDDVLGVPEFKLAYVENNLVMVGLGFPKRKAKLTDREKNPEKWAKSEKRYWEEVRSYLILHPESKRGLDAHLLHINAAAAWRARQERYEQRGRQRTMQLIQSRYLAARTETNYEGFAHLGAVPPGRYWLTNLWDEARAGDVHLRWELPVELRAGQRLYLELNNANALPAH